jgi:hypothetical protein
MNRRAFLRTGLTLAGLPLAYRATAAAQDRPQALTVRVRARGQK